MLIRSPKWSDIDDYIRWNTPENESFKYDGPWYENSRDMTPFIKRRIRDLKENKNEDRFLQIVVKEDGIHIGWVRYDYSDEDPHGAEIGIGIYETRFWNKGLGTEALALLLDYLFQKKRLTRVGYTTWSGNPRMIRVGEKLGFKLEARIRKSIYVFDKFYDRIQMGILAEEWEKKTGFFREK